MRAEGMVKEARVTNSLKHDTPRVTLPSFSRVAVIELDLSVILQPARHESYFNTSFISA
jgi:hypothetical protein